LFDTRRVIVRRREDRELLFQSHHLRDDILPITVIRAAAGMIVRSIVRYPPKKRKRCFHTTATAWFHGIS
jgi:hypothetical protein